jgi:hypothetical protein
MTERVDLAEGTAAKLWAYRLGFRDATCSVEGFVLVCDVGVKAADDILNARTVGNNFPAPASTQLGK